ncbi:MAG: DNA repair protein RecN [Saprospiraceae bacterium]|nr:DNA repair protein RecN [Saprospiraceae bacterium]
MLKSIRIKNYAIIDHLEIEWPEGFTAITGETGAGKSILIGALQFVLGNRADVKVLRNQNEKCVVEVCFSLNNEIQNQLDIILEEKTDGELILRREINPAGKSRTFINDTPALVQNIQTVAPFLISIHQQFDQLDLLEEAKQFELLDSFSQLKSEFINYKKNYSQYLILCKQIDECTHKLNEHLAEQDFIQFQFNELNQAQLNPDEYKQLEDDLNIASKSEVIIQNIQQINILLESEKGIIDQLQEVTQLLKPIRIETQIEEFYQSFIQMKEEIRELTHSLEKFKDRMEFDPSRLSQMQERFDQLTRLHNKYRVTSIEGLIEIKDQLQSKLKGYGEFEDKLKTLELNKKELETELIEQALLLRKGRLKNSTFLKKEIVDLLHQLGMEHGQFEINLTELDQLNQFGMDRLEYLFSANKGSSPKAIKNQASGGEISRLNLAIKSIVAANSHLPTLIFDEIDSGVSGQIALQMGSILRQMAEQHQLITITHSAQIASRAEHHFFVYKDSKATTTNTKLKLLNNQERLTEIAKMLSGDPPTVSAIKNAKELIALQ